MSRDEDKEKRMKKVLENEKNSDSFPATWFNVNDYTCTSSRRCQNPAKDFVWAYWKLE